MSTYVSKAKYVWQPVVSVELIAWEPMNTWELLWGRDYLHTVAKVGKEVSTAYSVCIGLQSLARTGHSLRAWWVVLWNDSSSCSSSAHLVKLRMRTSHLYQIGPKQIADRPLRLTCSYQAAIAIIYHCDLPTVPYCACLQQDFVLFTRDLFRQGHYGNMVKVLHPAGYDTLCSLFNHRGYPLLE